MSKSSSARSRGYGRFGWPVEWDHPAFPRTEVEASGLIARCHNRFSIMQDNLRRCLDSRGRRASRRWARVLMRSGSARIAVMDAACRHKGLKWNSLAVVRAGLALSLTRRSKEPVLMDLVEKADGRFRVVYDFGPREYARQKLAYLACKSSDHFAGQMFMHSGGVPAAARWLDENISSGSVVTTTDIPSAFWVMNRSHLEADGLLPKPVMQSVLYDAQSVGRRRTDKLLMGGSLASIYEDRAFYENRTSPGRSIPPGSALSPILTEHRIWKLLDAVQASYPEVMPGVYLDNIIILAPNEKAAQAANNAMLKAVLNEYGPEVSGEVRSRKRVCKASDPDGFYYLNDHYRFEKGRLVRRMSETAADLYSARLADRMRTEGLDTVAIKRSVKSWARQRAYDPRAIDMALEFLADYGVPKEDIDLVSSA